MLSIKKMIRSRQIERMGLTALCFGLATVLYYPLQNYHGLIGMLGGVKLLPSQLACETIPYDARLVHNDPLMLYMNDFISHAERDYLINLA